jgi:hypothetical protein
VVKTSGFWCTHEYVLLRSARIFCYRFNTIRAKKPPWFEVIKYFHLTGQALSHTHKVSQFAMLPSTNLDIEYVPISALKYALSRTARLHTSIFQARLANRPSSTGGVFMSDDPDGDHRQPPKSHRFQPGRSGNPRGRPKGTRNLATDLTRLLTKRIPVREDGETRHVSRQEAVLLRLYSKGVQGDVRAIMSLFTMLMKLEPLMPEPTQAQDEVTVQDEQIIEDYLRSHADTWKKDHAVERLTPENIEDPQTGSISDCGVSAGNGSIKKG